MATQAANSVRSRLRDPTLFREQAYIGGEWTDGGAKKQFPVFNPYSADQIGICPEMGHEGTLRAVEAAQKAFDSFQHTMPRKRMLILKNWFELMQEHEEDLATILSFENGRPIEAARAEIKYAASFFEWFQGEAVRSYGETMHSSTPSSRALTLKQPIGVVGIITPWNFPSAMITRKVGASVAAGCSVVVKPAAETPYSALALAELGERAGLPAGVFNVVTTDENIAEVGKVLCEHPTVKKLSFTGSTGVGKILMQQSSSSLKKLSMELGGNAPFIVFDDADFDNAIEGLMAAKFRASGQTCVCANRVYVQEGIYDKFVGQLAKVVENRLIPGDPMSESTTIGPLINTKAVKKVERLVEDACKLGATVVTGGSRSTSDPQTFYPATILTNMNSSMQASKEELFGPVVAFYPFKTEEDLLKLANDSEVGLASYVYTKDLSKAWRAAELLQTGMVGVNTGVISDPVAPFGGIKHSGFGREGGRLGIEEFQIIKTVTIGGLGFPEKSSLI
ncbi:succinate-semialdehyde dehydrogenase [Ilyonectria robusta]|uniref:succinate-semialdehyde dehydrogenase n=1 Tax=Ilyonectria robusta TaxID=1079257 RepID=UPI001E8D1F44|nr:succinate-semialdehyde dehydrogenase [Ilyonectria robusta]KAH8667709.1 succinate-semialdehyde dehydrogenase [Ilyonectria robusta]